MKGLVLCLALAAAAESSRLAGEERVAFPAVNVRDRDNQVRPIAELLGEVTVINFWATWCAPCRHELPELERLAAAFPGGALKVLAINVDSPPAAVETFITKTKLRLPVYFMDEGTQQSLGIDRLPYTLLLDGEGRVVRVYPGYSKRGMEDLRSQVKKLLGKAGGREGR